MTPTPDKFEERAHAELRRQQQELCQRQGDMLFRRVVQSFVEMEELQAGWQTSYPLTMSQLRHLVWMLQGLQPLKQLALWRVVQELQREEAEEWERRAMLHRPPVPNA